MATQDTDLLLIQRGNVPYKETAADFAAYIEDTIEIPTFEDPIIFQGLWSDPDTAPNPAEAGYLWIWDGNRQTLNNTDWGGINGEDITVNDRIYHNGTTFQLFTVSASDDQDLSYESASDKGTVKITNGTNAVIPLVTKTVGETAGLAGLMSPADKNTLDNLVSSPGGVVSITAGDGILVNTSDPHSAGAPEVSVNFGAVAGENNPVTVMPYDISMLAELPD